MNYGIGFLDGRTVGDRICEGNSEFNDVYSSARTDNVSSTTTTTEDFALIADVPAPPASIASMISIVSSGVGYPAVKYATRALYQKKSISNHQNLKRSTMTWRSIRKKSFWRTKSNGKETDSALILASLKSLFDSVRHGQL
jgi:hypothetical protein